MRNDIRQFFLGFIHIEDYHHHKLKPNVHKIISIYKHTKI